MTTLSDFSFIKEQDILFVATISDFLFVKEQDIWPSRYLMVFIQRFLAKNSKTWLKESHDPMLQEESTSLCL